MSNRTDNPSENLLILILSFAVRFQATPRDASWAGFNSVLDDAENVCQQAGRDLYTLASFSSPSLPLTLSRWQNVHWNLRYLPWYYYKRLGPRSGSDPAIIFTVKRIFHTQRVRVRLDVSFRVLSRGRRLRLAFIFACHKMFGDDTASDNANDKPERQPKKETATETERQRQHWNVAASGLHNFLAELTLAVAESL